MKIIFLSNFLNHTQKPLCDALFRQTNGNYLFVETEQIPPERTALGYKSTDEPYKITLTAQNREEIEDYVNNADIVIFGSAPYSLVHQRLKEGKMTFLYHERLFKEKPSIKSFFVSVLYFYLRWGQYKNNYLLCASAYASMDFNKILAFRGRALKWGYFAEVRKYGDINRLFEKKSSATSGRCSILWVARLIELKHPEFAIAVAERLKRKGIQFDLNIIGIGQLESEMNELIRERQLCDNVHLLGAMSPGNVRDYMEKGDIFLFTSDRNEGWGLVVNEAMNSCCAVVASHAAGSVPFLIDDNTNGFIYKDGDLDDAYSKVEFLINHSEERKRMCVKAYEIISNLWSPECAAQNFLSVVKMLSSHQQIKGLIGPCSKSVPLKDDWYLSSFISNN